MVLNYNGMIKNCRRSCPRKFHHASVFHRFNLAVFGLALVGVSIFAHQVHGVEVATNHWYIRARREVSPAEMREIVGRHGFSYVGPVMGSPREHHVMHRGVPQHDTVESRHNTQRLKREPLIAAAHQQPGFDRVKRGYRARGVPIESDALTAREMYRLDKQPNDPLYNKEWYLKNTGQAGGTPNLDLNVEAAWAQGVSGKGVTTAIMDDGIDYLHPDLADNFNAEASWDFSSNDPYPFPRYTDDWFNSHGTRCAGEISAMRDNNLCGVGVAYGSRIAGLRMLDQPFMTDLIEANSMSYRPDLVDIYSASWGPTDDGRTVDGPRNLTMRAIVKGVNEGRKGRGSIYVWASGDGGPDDDCNCDGYAASMWTISINSATNDGQIATYDESCSSTLASTFSNGKGFFDAGVATTDLFGNCTLRHSGTSAAAPEAAGVFALAIEANPKLTWRDIQHLTVLTSKRNQLYDSHGIHEWKMNGAGLEFNHLFGYGVLDAGGMVEAAKKWKSVPERFHCEGGVVNDKYKFDSYNPLELTINTDACAGKAKEQVNFLEHVQMVISLTASRRGSVVMHITSPMNTTSMILSERPKDMDNHIGFRHWPFMTTHTWAEMPKGVWRLRVQIHPREEQFQSGELTFWALELHGTQTAPYNDQETLRANSKIDIVKRAHEAWSTEK